MKGHRNRSPASIPRQKTCFCAKKAAVVAMVSFTTEADAAKRTELSSAQFHHAKTLGSCLENVLETIFLSLLIRLQLPIVSVSHLVIAKVRQRSRRKVSEIRVGYAPPFEIP